MVQPDTVVMALKQPVKPVLEKVPEPDTQPIPIPIAREPKLGVPPILNVLKNTTRHGDKLISNTNESDAQNGEKKIPIDTKL